MNALPVLRKLAACPRQNRIARALPDVGPREKTVSIRELLLDPRRRRRRGLSDGEAVNSTVRARFTGQRGEFRDRAFQDQVHRASCLHLLIAAVGPRTSPHPAGALGLALAALQDELRDRPAR
jgi:TnpA family transposase